MDRDDPAASTPDPTPPVVEEELSTAELDITRLTELEAADRHREAREAQAERDQPAGRRRTT